MFIALLILNYWFLQMELHNSPNIKKSSLRGDEMTLKEPHR